MDSRQEGVVMTSETERVNFRANKSTRHEAEAVMRAMGLNLSDGLNMFLARVAAEHRIPFPLAMTPEEIRASQTRELADAVTKSIREEVTHLETEGSPIARFDRERNQAYIEYTDGRREYLDG